MAKNKEKKKKEKYTALILPATTNSLEKISWPK